MTLKMVNINRVIKLRLKIAEESRTRRCESTKRFLPQKLFNIIAAIFPYFYVRNNRFIFFSRNFRQVKRRQFQRKTPKMKRSLSKKQMARRTGTPRKQNRHRLLSKAKRNCRSVKLRLSTEKSPRPKQSSFRCFTM